MPELKQIICTVREDFIPLLRMAEHTIHEVMIAGEAQRLKQGKDPNGWMKADPLDRLNHVLHHVLAVHHAQKPLLLTQDTCLEQIKHALTGILIILVNENREPEVIQQVIDE